MDNRWLHVANQNSIYVGTNAHRDSLQEHFAIRSEGQLHPRICVVDSAARIACQSVIFVETNIQRSEDMCFSLQYCHPHDVGWCLDDLGAQLPKSTGQRIIIQAEVTATPQAGLIMQDLEVDGWSLRGWWPSRIAFGGLCLVMGRVNPAMFPQK